MNRNHTSHTNTSEATKVIALIALVVAFLVGLAAPGAALAEDSGSVQMYRLYNPNSGEHFYTSSATERANVIRAGWRFEGVGWIAPESSSTPVYRLYNPNAGDHHYTTSTAERDHLVSVGWRYEGIGWYSSDAQTTAVLRQYNPNARAGAHNFTTSQAENDHLASVGWRAEGTGWYALGTGTPIMGATQATEAQMVAVYKRNVGNYYPYTEVAEAPTIEAFVHILVQQANSEGVRAEVVFAQAMHETGWLKFGGQVSASQYNFGGLGATNNGAAGNGFNSIAEGLLAQVQHLKAYASTAPLNQTCVDQRFGYVSRGVAPTVEGLQGRWAVPGTGYAAGINAIINAVLSA